MDKFQSGFYRHFKGKLYFAYGLAEYCPRIEVDVYFTEAMHHETLDMINVYKKEIGDGYLIEGDVGSEEKYVLYQELYGERNFWIRELVSFIGSKKFGQDGLIKRFVLQENDSGYELK